DCERGARVRAVRDGGKARHARVHTGLEDQGIGHQEGAVQERATNLAAIKCVTEGGAPAMWNRRIRSWTVRSPTAGPIARPMLIGSEFSATARVSSDRGTSSGVIACQVGAFIARPRRADVLHPGPDVGNERGDPECAEYRMRQRSPGRLGRSPFTTHTSPRR